jgi:hypothetical protein
MCFPLPKQKILRTTTYIPRNQKAQISPGFCGVMIDVYDRFSNGVPRFQTA